MSYELELELEYWHWNWNWNIGIGIGIGTGMMYYVLWIIRTFTTMGTTCMALVLELKLDFHAVGVAGFINVPLRCGNALPQALLRFAPTRRRAMHYVAVQPVAATACHDSKWHNQNCADQQAP